MGGVGLLDGQRGSGEGVAVRREQVLSDEQKALLWDANLRAADWLMENFSPDAIPPVTKGDVATAWAFALAGKS